MKLLPEKVYHIYNRGNNRQKIFFLNENYRYFLNKVKTKLTPIIDILAYCLMPNHFHFLIYTPSIYYSEKFSNNFKHILSSYTRAINNQESRTGSLFQQNSKAKSIEKPGYGEVCFNYIHQNPLASSLVIKMEDWEYSSFNEYLGITKNNICNTKLATELLNLPVTIKQFYEFSYGELDNSIIDNLY